MLFSIISYSLRNKFVVLLGVLFLIGFGGFSLFQLPIGAVPDVTNNQVQVITTSRNLSTEDMEQFITYPVELEMANLPGVQEIRSISKFGLSVVTIVFDDDLGTYLPRQLIAEKIEAAKSQIPEGFGTPFMGPISTGLGEIYQYTLDVLPEYKDRYSVTELRTIQDWIVKRQLSGIPGVVEVNTWGGYLKQYEVAINSNRLQAQNISVAELTTAIQNNNSVAGGAYIERQQQAHFIRGEGLIGSLEDLENIVVTVREGVPVYVRDVAKVAFGSAPRFGAITANGEGEKVLGQVMMLKNANSKKVIDAVNARVAEISKSLPEGVVINPFLDRSTLIAKTTATITENLVLGCLIVIFVVVLLLGNLRSGLVVASVIPLSLLFALGMMYVFGIDANLMSLGAIDFGIIIDGAVIIVEFIAFQIQKRAGDFSGLNSRQTASLKDEIALKGAGTMMNSAIFGQLIILIVFIPILSLSGVEGKMFKPMALTFSFALIGAMILCFTYVPVATALLVKPGSTQNWSDRLMRRILAAYHPIISRGLAAPRLTLLLAGILLAGSLFIFSRMGSEFVPTLDEGDFVIQPVLKTGTSLAQTIETTTAIETILLKEFPEVKQVVTRIGAAEVPTDPMSMEESDVIIVLEDKSDWVSATSKDELADKFKEALAVIPGMEVEFTQPIEMRFNELITGVRADIAIKVYGEDLDVLARKGAEIGALIQDVPGAADITVDKIDGLPEMNVRFDRQKIARYGLNIAELNRMITLGFAGSAVGSIFEGERRFDLVLRLEEGARSSLEDVKNLYVDLPGGGKIPMREVAEISYQKGAAKIARDDTRRRMVVGVNVRDRDLQSVVDDIRQLIDTHIQLPPGYAITYGGQFENLQSARSRLLVAVPIALFLIFVLLYFAFGSLKEALLIFTAIPFAAVGGILLLAIRGMPFSISAGVGFIALFGIAVLNGIVLIEHFKALKKQGMEDITALVVQGAKDRLRAVLLTAAAAALGFLPMALSTSAGAEVQRPLATVVIGGLVSATLLTLVVLPILYRWFAEKQAISLRPGTKALTLLLFLGFSSTAFAQERQLPLDSLTALALEHNAEVQAASLRLEQAGSLKGGALDLDKTQVFYSYDENNRALNDLPVHVWGVAQDLQFPTRYFARGRSLRLAESLASAELEIVRRKLQQQVAAAYQQLLAAEAIREKYERVDSLYARFQRAADRKFELGETNALEKMTARAKRQQNHITLLKAAQETRNRETDLRTLVQAEAAYSIKYLPLTKLEAQPLSYAESPEFNLNQHQLAYAESLNNEANQALLPDFSVSYFQGTNSGLGNSLYGVSLGMKVPLFFSGQRSRIKATQLGEAIAFTENRDYALKWNGQYAQLQNTLQSLEAALTYYEEEGNALAARLIHTAEASFKAGEIDFYQYIQSLENAYALEIGYIQALSAYNLSIIELNYFSL